MGNEKFIIRSDKEIIAAIAERGYVRDGNHQYIQYEDSPISGFITEASLMIIDYYLPYQIKSLAAWKKDKTPHRLNWKDNSETRHTSGWINYLIISKHLREKLNFDSKDFNLPIMNCHWLDSSLDLSLGFHFLDDSGKHAFFIEDGTPQNQYGISYPIKPSIDREGHIHNFSTSIN